MFELRALSLLGRYTLPLQESPVCIFNADTYKYIYI
jgi:hypothetical protein